jgi:hypothetical protein
MAEVFLPAPRVPAQGHADPDPAWLDEIRPGSGAPIAERLRLRREAMDAVISLEAARPGGQLWAAAMRDDADQASRGLEPKKWKVADLLRGDPDRWAKASALSRVLSARMAGELRLAQTDTALLEAARARRVGMPPALADACRLAWGYAEAGNRAEAWAHYEQATQMRDAAGRLAGLESWLTGAPGAKFTPGPCGWSEEDRGRYLAAEDTLRGTVRLTLPQNITWPRGYDPSGGVIDGSKFAALAADHPELTRI